NCTDQIPPRYAEGAKYYDMAIAIDPKATMAFFKRGQARQALWDYSGAFEDYTQAVALDPKFEGARKALFDVMPKMLQEKRRRIQELTEDIKRIDEAKKIDEAKLQAVPVGKVDLFDARLKF